MDVETIYRHERRRWFKEEALRKTIREYIADSVPYWIGLVAVVLYGLSAPHTAAVFDKLTPGWGWIAPLGVEFGLLYAAFRRRFARQTCGGQVSRPSGDNLPRNGLLDLSRRSSL